MKQDRLQCRPNPGSGALRAFALSVALAAGIVGCSSEPTTRPSTLRERQDAAMKDPMGYKVDFSNSNVSSRGISEFDKDGFKKDVNSVFNP